MKWKSIQVDGYPKTDCICWVKNEKGWMSQEVTCYDSRYQVFKLITKPPMYNTLLLDVTHYCELPA